MGKLPGDFSDWKWPWEKGEIDEEKAARLIFNARRAEEAAAEKAKEAEDKVASLTADLDAAKAAKSGTDAEGQAELKDLRKKVRELEEAGAKSLPADEAKINKLKAALEYGLTEKQAMRLQGDDLDAIREDAKSFAQDLGIEIEDNPGSDGGDEFQPPPIQQPQPRYRTGALGADRTPVTSNPTKMAEYLPPLN